MAIDNAVPGPDVAIFAACAQSWSGRRWSATRRAEQPLPPEVDQAAYRIVQEALTNVRRHAGLSCASVRLQYAPGALTVQVDDDGNVNGGVNGNGTRPAGLGLGLVGMRERVAALGGRL